MKNALLYLYIYFLKHCITKTDLTFSQECNYAPTILIHGIASSKNELVNLELYLNKNGVPTYNIEIGNGIITSTFMDMNTQCEEFAYKVKELELYGKINIIGISQGGLISRCYVEKYSNTINSVNTFMTLGTPHMGYFNENISISTPSANGYIKNPFYYSEYLANNDFLSYINNDKPHLNSELYKKNIEDLGSFVIVWSGIDKVIVPRESSKFEYYSIEEAVFNRSLVIVPLEESLAFNENNIGLKTLYNQNKLNIYRFDCEHDMFKTEACFSNILNTTFPFLCVE